MSSADVGLYRPGDQMWRVNREAVLLLSGPRALLMQIAHPLVAAGVAEHSEFRSDPLARLRGTLEAMLGMIYGSHEEAQRHAQRVNAIHEHVAGRLSTETAAFERGTAYSALDPALLFWVQATLIDSALTAYECFVAPLGSDEKQRLYEESKSMAPLLRLPISALPSDYPEFRRAVDDTLRGDTLEVTPEARAIADAVLHPGLLHLPRWVWQLGGIVPLGLLPQGLRARYGFAWSRRHELTFRFVSRSLRTLRPLTPELLRTLPRARRAERERATPDTETRLARRAGSPP